MELLNKNDFSLGLEPFDVLGFKTEEELNNEISELIKVRPEFESNHKVSQDIN